MQCTKCGQTNPPEALFCGSCGESIASKPAPGVGRAYRNAWQALWKHFPTLLAISIVYLILTNILSGPYYAFIPNSVTDASAAALPLWFSPNVTFDIISWAYAILLQGPLSVGIAFVYLKAARGNHVEFKDLFAGFRNYWNAVLAILLLELIIGIGLVLLIVPGVVLACKLAVTPYLVVDRKMTAIEAIKESWRMTSGHAWKVFLVGLLAIPVAVGGLVVLVVGVIPAVMWIYLAFASLYVAVSRPGEARLQHSPPVVPGGSAT